MNRLFVMELVSSVQSGELTRRDFLTQASLALGSVSAATLLLAACASVNEQTSPEGDSSHSTTAETATPEQGTVSYPGEERELSGYLAKPDRESSLPGVVVIQEWWGLNDHIRQVTRRVAEVGYVALAPDLYHGVVVSEPDEARKLVMELDMEAAVREIGSAIQFLRGRQDVAGKGVGVVGFCMGGRLALQVARSKSQPDAVVAFYGTPLAPNEVASVRAPVLGLYGQMDQGIPLDRVAAMADALDRAGIENDIVVYEGAEHAFFNDTRAAYDPESAADAWKRMVAWFQRHLSQEGQPESFR